MRRTALWYASEITSATSATIPAGVLLPDAAYAWYIRTFDSVGHPMNCAESDWGYFYTGASAETPAIAWAEIGARPPSGVSTSYGFWIDAKAPGLAPWEITATRWKNASGGIIAQSSGVQYPVTFLDQTFYELGISTAAAPVSGNYTLEMDYTRSGQTGTIVKNDIPFTYTAVDAVDLTSLTPVGNYYFKTTTPTFSWNPVTDPNTYYRARIFDPMSKTTIWKSGWSKEVTATVPAGVLIPGGTYLWSVMTTPAIDPTSYVNRYVNTEDSPLSMTAYRFTVEPSPKGDLSGNGEINMEDAILALQLVAGKTPPVLLSGDVDNNRRIGLPEALYILQSLSGQRY